MEKNYEIPGQINLEDYLESIKLPSYCEDCVFLENFKCGLNEGHCVFGSKSLCSKDGWNRIKHNPNNTVSGKWPECREWLPVNTFHYNPKTGKYAYTEGAGKDKTFKWTKEQQVGSSGFDVIAWRYKKI